METKLYFPNANGDKLCGIISNPAEDKNKPLIIMLHGFTADKKSKKWVALQKVFDNQNISSFRFDAYGHGESDGNFEDITITEAIDDILYAIQYLKAQGYTRLGLLGASFGGLASIIAASQTRDLLALALIAPVSDYEEVERKRKTPEEMVLWEERGFSFAHRKNGEKLKLNYTFFEDAKNNLAYDVAAKISIPTLIVHGDMDITVPVAQSKKTAELIPQCDLVIVQGADHFFSEEKHFAKMVKAVSEFMISHSNLSH